MVRAVEECEDLPSRTAMVDSDGTGCDHDLVDKSTRVALPNIGVLRALLRGCHFGEPVDRFPA